MSAPKLPPLPQEYFDDNRERFSAETVAVEHASFTGCRHYFIRKTGSEIGCRNCPNGWIDAGRFVIENGKVISVK